MPAGRAAPRRRDASPPQGDAHPQQCRLGCPGVAAGVDGGGGKDGIRAITMLPFITILSIK
jgi:hypothetical protein